MAIVAVEEDIFYENIVETAHGRASDRFTRRGKGKAVPSCLRVAPFARVGATRIRVGGGIRGRPPPQSLRACAAATSDRRSRSVSPRAGPPDPDPPPARGPRRVHPA